MENNISIEISADYAVLTTDNYTFYYGYEIVHKGNENEWCFDITNKHGESIYRICQTEITNHVNRELSTPEEYLLAGIGLWVRYYI